MNIWLYYQLSYFWFFDIYRLIILTLWMNIWMHCQYFVLFFSDIYRLIIWTLSMNIFFCSNTTYFITNLSLNYMKFIDEYVRFLFTDYYRLIIWSLSMNRLYCLNLHFPIIINWLYELNRWIYDNWQSCLIFDFSIFID